MSLKAVLFDFNSVIINDNSIHEKLITQLLLEENLTIKRGEYQQFGLGQTKRTFLRDFLNARGRAVKEDYITQLLLRKAQRYAQELEKLEQLPFYQGLDDLIFQLRSKGLKFGLVTDAIRKEVEIVFSYNPSLTEYFQIVVTGDDVTSCKPELDGYLLAVERLNQEYPDLNLQPYECLAIVATPAGIEAAKNAGMQVVGIANTYPFHMLQRQANWTVDYLMDLELERTIEVFSQKESLM
jgi:beta-phosphoglucomutase